MVGLFSGGGRQISIATEPSEDTNDTQHLPELNVLTCATFQPVNAERLSS